MASACGQGLTHRETEFVLDQSTQLLRVLGSKTSVTSLCLFVFFIFFPGEKAFCHLALFTEHCKERVRIPARVIRKHGQLLMGGLAAFLVQQQGDKTLLNRTTVPRGQAAFTEGVTLCGSKGLKTGGPRPLQVSARQIKAGLLAKSITQESLCGGRRRKTPRGHHAHMIV